MMEVELMEKMISPKPLHPLQRILAETGLTPRLSLILDLPVFELSGEMRHTAVKQTEDHIRTSESAELWDPGTEGLTLYSIKSFHYYYFPMNDITLWLKNRENGSCEFLLLGPESPVLPIWASAPWSA